MSLAGMRVAWFVDLGHSFVSEDMRLCVEHNMAGLRLRTGLPAQALAQRGGTQQPGVDRAR